MMKLRIEKYEDNGIWAFRLVDERGLVVADVGEWATKATEAEDLAWANLFAAAPDLLAALKAFVDRPLFDGFSAEEWEPMARAAFAAIAKAEGRAS